VVKSIEEGVKQAMETKTTDIREELKARMDEVQKQIDSLNEERDRIDNRLQVAHSKLKALREIYESEGERFGEPSLPLWSGKDKTYRFAGMKLIDAVSLIRQEQPEINKKQVRQILEKADFDFRGKRPGTAIHFVWIALDRRKKGEQ